MVSQGDGLRGVIAGQTRICRLDAQQSSVLIRGHSLEDLTSNFTYEAIAHLTLTGDLPASVSYRLPVPDPELLIRIWRTLSMEPQQAHPMGLLRTSLSSYGNHLDARASTTPSYESEQAAALELTAFGGHLLAQVACHARGDAWEPAEPTLTYAETILRQFHPEPDEVSLRAFEIAQMVYVEHELNAGTFTARIAASAHTDLYSAVVAGECVLRGSRHGCANEEAMRMLLDQGGKPDAVRDYCDRFFETPGARLPGFGNAVYNLPHSHDPRATILRPWLKQLSERKGDMRWYETILALEEYMTERSRPRVERGGQSTPVNVDLIAAPIYYLLGIPIEVYTPLFASARIPGWAAHYLEARYVNKEALVRPRAEYVGV